MSKITSFYVQKMFFYNTKDYLLTHERLSFDTRKTIFRHALDYPKCCEGQSKGQGMLRMTHQFSRELRTLVRANYQFMTTKLVNSLENCRVLKEHTGRLSSTNGRFRASKHAVYVCKNAKNMQALCRLHVGFMQALCRLKIC